MVTMECPGKRVWGEISDAAKSAFGVQGTAAAAGRMLHCSVKVTLLRLLQDPGII